MVHRDAPVAFWNRFGHTFSFSLGNLVLSNECFIFQVAKQGATNMSREFANKALRKIKGAADKVGLRVTVPPEQELW